MMYDGQTLANTFIRDSFTSVAEVVARENLSHEEVLKVLAEVLSAGVGGAGAEKIETAEGEEAGPPAIWGINPLKSKTVQSLKSVKSSKSKEQAAADQSALRKSADDSGQDSPWSKNRRSLAGGGVPRSSAYHALKKAIRKMVDNIVWKVAAFASLFIALFGGALFVLFDVSDDPGTPILDTIMLIVMLFFIVEIVVTWIAERAYHFSFFFWMDVAGTISMIFEISWMLGGDADVNTVVLRAARTAKLGARVGRLSKLLKVLLKKPDPYEVSKAKVLTQNLMFALSTKVSFLTIVLVMLLPLFSIPLYPYEDMSMKLWSQRLEELYRWELEAVPTNLFEVSLQHLESFYGDEKYHPYKIEGYLPDQTIDGSKVSIQGQYQLLGTREPNRKTNQKRAEVNHCRLSRAGCSGEEKAKIYFDFTTPNQLEAGMGIALIVFMMIVMIYMAYNIERVVEALVVTPLERMLNVVRVHAAKVMRQFQEAHGVDEDGEEENAVSEVEMLELVIRKLARLAEQSLKKNVINQFDLANMEESAQAALEMMEVKVVDSRSSVCRHSGVANSPKTGMTESESAPSRALKSWEVDVLSMNAPQLQDAAVHMFFESELGQAAEFVDRAIFLNFHKIVKATYKDLPYHCYAHAIDVLHCVFRILALVRGDQWLSGVECYALLVAALCHDLGHFGKTNPFLIETGHDLAVRYNDKSPLENMHCATLFQICGDSSSDVFSKATAVQRKEARKVCIDSILHTDMANHFKLVQDISQCAEVNMELCSLQAGEDELIEEYLSEVLVKEKTMWIELFLHFADVSNPLKPFVICKAWAGRVLDEFFSQGDEEKQLGLPVGMMNDRNKVNRPGSQHGFINFLVAPLVTHTVTLFPRLLELHVQMASNMESWRNLWVDDVKPSAEDIEKKDKDVQKLKDVGEELRRRSDDFQTVLSVYN